MTSISRGALALGTVALLLVVTHLFVPAVDHSNLDEKLNESYGKLVELHYNGQKESKKHNDNVSQRLSVIEEALDKLSQEVMQTDRLLEPRANLDSKQAQTAFPSQVKSQGQITTTSQHQAAEGTAAEDAAVAALEEKAALSEEEDPSATMHGRRWSYAAALGNHGNEIRLPRAHELPRQAPNGTATWEAPRGLTLGKYTVSEIQEASGIDYSVPSSTLVVFHHVTHHAGTYWCNIAKAHYHGAVDPHACNRIATRRMPFKGYLIRKNRMPGDHNFPVKGSKWDKGGAEMNSSEQMTQIDAINDSTLKTPLMIRGRDLRELGPSWISYESYFPLDPRTKDGPAAAFDNLALDRRIGLVFVTRHPLTRLLSFDGGNKKLRVVECEEMNREVLAAGGSDTFDCSQAGTKNDWPIGPRSNPTKECELVWRNQQWAAEKENYSLRWTGGSYSMLKTSRDKINREYLKEAKRRVALGDVVITTHDTPKSICVMCKAFRWNEQRCALQHELARTRVLRSSSHNSLEYSRDRFVGCIKKFRRKHEDATLQDLQAKTKVENLQTKLSKSEEVLLRRIDGEYAWARLAEENALGIEHHEWMTKLFETQAKYYGCTDG